MKKTAFVLAILLCLLSSCSSGGKVASDDTSNIVSDTGYEITETIKEDGKNDPDSIFDMTGVQAVDISGIRRDAVYKTDGGDVLSSYFEKDKDTFLGVCKYYEQNGYSLYSRHIFEENLSATYYKGSEMAHFYWMECESELNVVLSQNGGEALSVMSGKKMKSNGEKISVTQLRSSESNGMGYVIRLYDGSFIVIDGGHKSVTEELYDALCDLNGGSKGIIIRAWLLTHGHIDHVNCITEFTQKYVSNVKLETLMVAMLNAGDINDYGVDYDSIWARRTSRYFSGSKLLYLHTGMVFDFGGVKLEILFTPDELYIADKHNDNTGELIQYNNTCVVSRVYTDNYSCIFLGDMGDTAAYRMLTYCGKYLKSDMCQVSHHGFEDFPLIAYRHINAAILWYPCSEDMYYSVRDAEIKRALQKSKYTKEVILHEASRETRFFE